MDQTVVKENTKCCVCGFDKLSPILSLGELYFSDFIEGELPSDHKKFPLELVLCDKNQGGCSLLQLKHFVPHEFMYRNYWYRSGVNQSMTNELKSIAKTVESLVDFGSDDYVIDIGANDGTLLRSYSKNVQRIGFEPARNLMSRAREGTTHIINEFFSYEDWQKEFGDKKAKAVTAIAMFYDLPDPNKFVSDIVKCLDDEGVFIVQMAYLPLMLRQNAFDNICHEHLQYYSLLSLENLFDKHNLEIFDIGLNDVNGGSFRVYIRHKGKGENLKIAQGADMRLDKLRSYEQEIGLGEQRMYDSFVNRVMREKDYLVNFIKEETSKGKKVYIYGASTKGNTLLQFYNLDNNFITAAAERNPDKWGRKTIGTNIPIISEEEARSNRPDYFLVLPWHFMKEFVDREKEFLNSGGKFIVPLPKFEIIGN